MVIGSNESCNKEILREELKKRLTNLIIELEEAQKKDSCYEVREYVDCPPDGPPPPRREPHPYIPGRVLYNYPVKVWTNQRVTVDGRLAQPYNPDRFYFEEQPIRVPPWSKPRYPSMELRGGSVYQGCDCWRRNGMQDECRRWDCDGRPECSVLACPPSMHPPYLGVRHKNGFETVPQCKDQPEPFGPFHMKDIDSFTKVRAPMAPKKGPMPEDVEPCQL